MQPAWRVIGHGRVRDRVERAVYGYLAAKRVTGVVQCAGHHTGVRGSFVRYSCTHRNAMSDAYRPDALAAFHWWLCAP